MRALLAVASAAVLLIILFPIPTPMAPQPKVISGPHLMQPNPDVYPVSPFLQAAVPEMVDVQPARAQERLLVLLIQFPGTGSTVPPGGINSIIFGANGSLTHYYQENSYGRTVVAGQVYPASVYLTAPNPMSEYGADSPSGIDDLNGPVFRLVTDAVRAADSQGFDFRSYDTDGDGVVDHIMVVHAGQGQETSSTNPNLIWSHRWAVLDSDQGRPGDQPLMTDDGVRVYSYFMASEFSPVGVFAHEFGHDFGLPDLYDTDGSSKGAGVWDIMASGSWLGNPRGTSPSHFSAWTKVKLGWIQPNVVTLPLIQASLPQAETTPRVYQLPIKSSPQGDEYFMVENRQRVGYDAALPGAGLLIWHVDEAMQDNDNDGHRLVTLENADYGLWGDSPDRSTNPWVSSETGFTPTSVPNSNAYGNVPTNWMVRRISAAGATMSADIAKEVAYDLSVAEVARSRFIEDGATANLRAMITNKGALNVSQVQVNLTLYRDTYGAASVVARNTTALATLASGLSVNVTWSYTPGGRGRYVLEVTADLAPDEVPQDNFAIVHFTVVSWLMRDDVEAGGGRWSSSAGAASQYDWQILSSTNPNGSAYSPTHAWRFGFARNTPLPLNDPYYTLTSNATAIAGSTPRLAFFHRYDLTGKSQNGASTPLAPINTDVATVEVSFDGGPWRTVGRFTGTQLAWELYYADLTPLQPSGATNVRISFNSTAGVMPSTGGWWIDDIMILEDALLPGLAVRPIEAYNTVPPGGRSLYHFTLVNVGDVLQATTFQVQLPGGWKATLGTNDTVLIPATDFSTYAPVDVPTVLVMGVEAPFLVERGTKVQGTLTATAVNSTASSSFTFIAEVSSTFTLSFNETTLLLGIMVAAMLVVITIVLEEVKKRRHRRTPLRTAPGTPLSPLRPPPPGARP